MKNYPSTIWSTEPTTAASQQQLVTQPPQQLVAQQQVHQIPAAAFSVEHLIRGHPYLAQYPGAQVVFVDQQQIHQQQQIQHPQPTTTPTSTPQGQTAAQGQQPQQQILANQVIINQQSYPHQQHQTEHHPSGTSHVTQALETHKRPKNEVTTGKVYECTICARIPGKKHRFSSGWNLRLHQSRQHPTAELGGPNPLVNRTRDAICGQCDKAFFDKNALGVHIARVHNKETR